jgi:hypothetical protein
MSSVDDTVVAVGGAPSTVDAADAVAALATKASAIAAAPLISELQLEERVSLLGRHVAGEPTAMIGRDREARHRGQRQRIVDPREDLMFSLVDRLAPPPPTADQISRMSRGRLLLTQCVSITVAVLFFLAVAAYSLAHVSNSEVAQIIMTTLNSTLTRVIEANGKNPHHDNLAPAVGTDAGASINNDDASINGNNNNSSSSSSSDDNYENTGTFHFAFD